MALVKLGLLFRLVQVFSLELLIVLSCHLSCILIHSFPIPPGNNFKQVCCASLSGHLGGISPGAPNLLPSGLVAVQVAAWLSSPSPLDYHARESPDFLRRIPAGLQVFVFLGLLQGALEVSFLTFCLSNS